ncbi:head-tail connector protein [Flavobacterium algicola]|uniref:head-tail connector protein n=1 Tax=Flavobacterium algicola TaxID=556529 RepID=UPI001EFDA228|nr:head-tail connector protein [Flavobacterium algicola]MCG9792487.1 head-tail connector protein [Flavobacterium algicola]
MANIFYYNTTATAPLLTLDQCKKQLNIELDFEDQDELIMAYNDAAQVACQNFINRSIAQRDLILECSNFDKIVYERNYDNDTIAKIEYYPFGGDVDVPVVLEPEHYKLRNSSILGCSEIKFAINPALSNRDDAVIVTISQGFTAETCPTPILQAIKLRIGDFYERREDRDQGNNSIVNNLLRAYRNY